jgi:hypothetical protein
MGTAWERHGMCESALKVLIHIKASLNTSMYSGNSDISFESESTAQVGRPVTGVPQHLIKDAECFHEF